jgi:hypothetical protein
MGAMRNTGIEISLGGTPLIIQATSYPSVMRDTGLHLLMEYMRKNGMVAMVVIGLNPGLEKI